MSTTSGSLLEDVFNLLEIATKLEEDEKTKIEAATKVSGFSAGY